MSQSPQLGYNHNIPHQGRLFHVQTEDSGRERAHIFTHIFFHGTIIASKKTEYVGVGEEGIADGEIVEQMKESHKAMIRLLRDQEFDEKIIQLLGPHPDAATKDSEAKKEEAPTPEEEPRGRAPSAPRPVPDLGPPLQTGSPGPALDPGLSHPLFAHENAQAQIEAKAKQQGDSDKTASPRRGPRRVQRRTVGGIGGQGVSEGTTVGPRRDVIIGQFASEHQAELDEEILALLQEE